MKIPMPVVANTYIVVTPKKSQRLPFMGTWNIGPTTRNRLRNVPMRMTTVMEMIFERMICMEVRGETVSCSMVPRSFSRTMAVAGKSSADRAMTWINWESD